MDQLWAPWRHEFIYVRQRRGCIFCRAVKSRANQRHYVVSRSRHAFALLNIYPYNNGHVMVAPRRHMASLTRCRDAELLDLWRLVNAVQTRLQRVLRPQGFNLGVNVGRPGGAGIPGHVHVHVVPRWTGDTNFMPVVAHTKIISDSLDALYQRLAH
jgi:ATP adenylyltransferase